MNDLKQYKFNSLYEMGSGISTTAAQAGHGAPFVSFSTIFNNVILPEVLPDRMDTSAEEQEKYSVKKGDILLTRTSETLDELAMSSVAVKDYPNATFSGFAKRLRPLQNDVTYDKFMAFYLRSPYFRKIVDANAIMTLRASFNEDIFSYIKLWLPDYETQVKIGDFFWDIEQKIRNNEKISSNLESIARLLYDYWFVQFDFPDDNGKPYKSSGGKMIWSEELKRDIPDGWEVGCFGDVLSSLESGDRPSGGAEDNGIPSIGAENIIGIGKYDFRSEKYIPEEYFNNMRNGVVQSWDVLMYKDGAGVGQASMFGDGFPYEKCAINSHAFILRSENNLYQDYLYLTLCQEYIKKLIIVLAMKAAQPGLNQPAVKSIPLVIPKKQVVEMFNQKVDTMFHKIFACANENRQLASLREFLLPMLMNGQVKFEDA